MAPESDDYNCIAWSIGNDKEWVWPNLGTIEDFDKLYKDRGLVPTAEQDKAVIVLYADDKGQPTHAARRLEGVGWTSKLGSIELIAHELDWLNSENGQGGYGRPVKYYARAGRGLDRIHVPQK